MNKEWSMPIIVPIEENKVGPATATDAKFRAPDTSGSGLEALGAGLIGKLKPTDPKITDFTRYPDIGDIAAGRYQIERKNMYTTGVRNLGITSFNPNDQDMMAAFVLRHYGIIDKIEAGDFAGAMPKLANFGVPCRCQVWHRA
jgi:hypothetical protein